MRERTGSRETRAGSSQEEEDLAAPCLRAFPETVLPRMPHGEVLVRRCSRDGRYGN